jgi:hypothetical protein
MLRPRIISFSRRSAIHRDARTTVQIDKHIDMRLATFAARTSVRPVVHRSATQIHTRITAHTKSLRMKHPEAPRT